jgi:AmmeMemoRadiSam system protein B/AmmeMemoRadiSam system protein A
MSTVHISPYSGTWYPSNEVELERLIDECFEASASRTGPYLLRDGLGFVVPHAGPQYSGVVAAAVYRSLRQQKPERIILLAFPHRGGLRGAAVPRTGAVSTPLGDVAIDQALGAWFPQIAEDRVCDHSFEIQLPFLQKSARGARLSPLYVGPMSDSERRRAAEILAEEWRPGTVFLASSDFTHYGHSFGYVPFPVDDRISEHLQELDFKCIQAAGSLDCSFFHETLAATAATVCGSDPIALLVDTLHRLRSGDSFQVTLDYQTSGEITGDYHHSVSYAALGYYDRSAFELCTADSEALLSIAHETLRLLRATGQREWVCAADVSLALESRRGVFVSLHRGAELLGCVGCATSSSPLAEAVPEFALAAALEDPRFRPGAAVEGPVDIEISVLTPLRRVRDASSFQVGRHGASLSLGGRSGLLLPQVAAGRGWSAGQFLAALARKSGVDPEDPRARMFVFEAQVFARRECILGKSDFDF